MQTFISFEQALEEVLRSCHVLEPEHVALAESLGRVLASDIISSENIPPFASSAMDGFAVRHEDLLGCETGAVSLRLIDHIAAGQVSNKTIEPGTCAKIMTGAPIPPGATAVVPREAVENGTEGPENSPEAIVFRSAIEYGKHVRPAAEDVRVGDTVLVKGVQITPPAVGMLATLGYDRVPVVRKPRVRVISTGDEIIPPSWKPGPGQIRNSNGPGLRAQALCAGASCDQYEHVSDNPEAIRALITGGEPADLWVFSGGVSVGDHDYVKAVLEELGMQMVFWKVRQRPGKPLAFGKLGKTLVLGLPGNPVSSAMCFEVYARPMIKALLGEGDRTDSARPMYAELSEAVEKVKDLHYFARGLLTQSENGRRTVVLTGPQGSNLYHSVVKANCIVHLPEGQTHVPQGAKVRITPLLW